MVLIQLGGGDVVGQLLANWKAVVGLLALGILAYWVFDAREDAEGADELVENVGERAERGLGGAFGALTSLAIVLLSIATTIGNELLEFGGDLAMMLGNSPVVAAHIGFGSITLGSMFAGIGLSATDLWWIFVVLTLPALIWRYSDDDSMMVVGGLPVGLIRGDPIVMQADPVSQAVAWALAAIRGPFAGPIAAVLGVLLAMFLVRRFRSGEDPSLQYQSETEAGYASILLSGTHVTMLLVGGIAFVTWPLPLENKGFGLLLLLAIAGHYMLEKREAREGSQSALLRRDD